MDEQRILTIDPGTKCTGWAFFSGGVLEDCGLSRATSIEEHWHNLKLLIARADRVVSEKMYNRGDRTVRVQDLLELNLLAGRLAREWVYPHEWKGYVPKNIHQPRIIKHMAVDERQILGGVRPLHLRHNTVDAIGIGLVLLGRMERKT